jgi:M6 family metalloprotease-like protein
MPQPFINERFTFTQPDGTELEVVGTGNQFEAVFETPDGYTVVKEPFSGFYQYAQLSADATRLEPSGEVVTDGAVVPVERRHLRTTPTATRVRAQTTFPAGERPRWETRRRQQLARAAAAGPFLADAPDPAVPSGDVTGLCLLIQFPDVAGTITRQQVDDFCNLPGYAEFGNNGSVRDYFVAASQNRLRYTNVVTAYHTAAHNRSHYTDPAIPYGQRAQELIHEALAGLSASGFDFSSLTADSAGNVYALNVFYAGNRVNNWSEGLWPHAWTLATQFDIGGGRRLADYQITDIGTQLTLRTFCHENGHMVCDFPDLYDYGSDSAGIGHYCLMCFGGNNLNPVDINAALKHQAGWTTTLRTATPGATYRLAASANDFLIHQRSPQEYFICENRNQTGRDASIPDSGLAIWHYEAGGNNSNQQMTPASHYLISLEQSDGAFHMENNLNLGDTTDLYAGPGPARFDGSSTPSSHWWDGSPSGFDVASVSGPGAEIEVTVGAGLRLVVNNFGYDAGGWRVDMHPRALADVTGDGRADIVGFGNAGAYVSRSRADGTFSSLVLGVTNFGYNAGGWRVDRHPRFLADTTGDGRDDIVGFGNAGVYVSKSNGDGTFAPPVLVVTNFGYDAGGWRVDMHPRVLADVTGEGRADIVGFGDAGAYVSRSRADGTFAGPVLGVNNFGYVAGGWRVDRHPRFLADTTGDGRADIVGFGNAGAYVSTSNGDGTFAPPVLVVNNFGYDAGGWRVDRHPRFLADVTGDGRADIVGFGNAGAYVSIANGDGTFAAPVLGVNNYGYDAGGWRVDLHPRIMADTTGDGRDDIVGFGNAGVYVSTSNGDGTFAPPQLVVNNFGYTAGGWRVDRHPRFLADTTGDGRADIIGFGSAGAYAYTWSAPVSP